MNLMSALRRWVHDAAWYHPSDCFCKVGPWTTPPLYTELSAAAPNTELRGNLRALEEAIAGRVLVSYPGNQECTDECFEVPVTFRPCCGNLWEETHKKTCGRYCQECRGDLDSCEHGLVEEWHPKTVRWEVLRAIQSEGLRADVKHREHSMLSGDTCVTDFDRLAILGEEFGEVCRAVNYDTKDPENLKDELVQLATMAAAWYDVLTRPSRPTPAPVDRRQ